VSNNHGDIEKRRQPKEDTSAQERKGPSDRVSQVASQILWVHNFVVSSACTNIYKRVHYMAPPACVRRSKAGMNYAFVFSNAKWFWIWVVGFFYSLKFVALLVSG
jgi:hypothetical protein